MGYYTMLTPGQGHLIPGMGDYTDDGSEAMDAERIEREWLEALNVRALLDVVTNYMANADQEGTTNDKATMDEIENCVELRNSLMNIREELWDCLQKPKPDPPGTDKDLIERLSRENAALITENQGLVNQNQIKDKEIERLTPNKVEIEENGVRSVYTLEQIDELFVKPVRDELQAALDAAVKDKHEEVGA